MQILKKYRCCNR